MEKLKDLNWPFIVFILLGVTAAVNASVSLALSTLVFGLFNAFKMYLDDQKRNAVDVKFQEEIKKENQQLQGELKDIKSYVSGLTLQQTVVGPQEKRRFF